MRDLALDIGPRNCILTNANVWSPDARWIVYDVRSTAVGEVFDGDRIERVNVETGEVQVLYEARHGAHVGVATYHPIEDAVIFIQGPEKPTTDWSYSAAHRQAIIVYADQPNVAIPLEARDLTPPFTPGALRGGTHVHMFSPDAQCVSFTYDDAIVGNSARNVGVSALGRSVTVPKTHPRNRDGRSFSVIVTETTAHPQPGSDQIGRAYEDAWIGNRGYRRADGKWQSRALAFIGDLSIGNGQTVAELFVVDLPDDLTIAGPQSLCGTTIQFPAPPRGTLQRRLTFTIDRPFPGLQGPRHWPRSSPSGDHIAFLMRDNAGMVQLWTIPTIGGLPRQLTHSPSPIASAFTWSGDGQWIAYIAADAVWVVRTETGQSQRVSLIHENGSLLPLAAIISPDGARIAYQCRSGSANAINQIRVCEISG